MTASPDIKNRIVAEIQRIAVEIGKVPGVSVFTQKSGIAQHEWYGVIWARWSDALSDAGLEKNALQERFSSNDVLQKVVEASLKQGRVPTVPEMKILRRTDSSFPNPKTVAAHFGNRAEVIEIIRKFCVGKPVYSELLANLPLPPVSASTKPTAKLANGWVYILKSGPHYKIGRSDTVERRIKEISIALPESVQLIHAIETDDPPGIESYWHRRFADRRANGEWFKLDANDLRAFKRRKFQ